MKIKFALFSALIAICAYVVWSSLASAATPSLWMGAGTITKMLIASNVTSDASQKYCQRSTLSEIKYKIDFLTKLRLFDKTEPVDGCWHITSFGKFGSGKSPTNSSYYISFGLYGRAVRFDNPYYHTLLPLKRTGKLAGIYNASGSRYMYIYDDFARAVEQKEQPYYDVMSVVPDATKWNFTDTTTGQAVRVGHVASSENGEWMIMEANGGFVRLNTMTKEVLMFERSLYGYGYGQDPTYELTISNDGRYAVIAGGNVVDRIDYIYDLSTCIPQAAVLLPASGCTKRNLKTDVFPQLATNQAAQRFVFSDDSENMTVDVPESGAWNRYVLTSPGATQYGLEYLALGDSYQSGEGDGEGSIYYMKGTDGDGASVPAFHVGVSNFPYQVEKCHLSSRSYPYLLAQFSVIGDASFRIVACSGSAMNDITNVSDNLANGYLGIKEQFGGLHDFTSEKLREYKNAAIQNLIPGRAAQIEFVSRYKPRVVTIGIGGNNIGFGSKIESCMMPLSCAYTAELRQSVGAEIHGLYKPLHDTYTNLHNASPATRFYAIGYPQIIADPVTQCTGNVHLDTDEIELTRQTISYLNQVIKAAATDAGFTYVDIENSLPNGGRLCGLDGNAKSPYVNGLTYGDDIAILGLAVIGQETFHPTSEGHAVIARSIEKSMGYQSILDNNPCAPAEVLRCAIASPVPAIPSYFSAYTTHSVDTSQSAKIINDPQLSIDGAPALKPGDIFTISALHDTTGNTIPSQPATSAQAVLYSSPHDLGMVTIRADGQPNGTVTIPADIEPGYHTLVLYTTTNLHQRAAYYQPVIIYASLDDVDGDGVANKDDVCSFVAPIGVDTDRDSIDDACDGIIDDIPDVTAPVVTPVISEQPNENGWYDHDVLVSWQVHDDLDTDLAVPTATMATSEGEHTYESPDVCDKAGNCARGSLTIRLDKTAPEIGTMMWSKNPKSVGESSMLSALIVEQTSGTARTEYFIGDVDPGRGNGAAMNMAGDSGAVVFGTDFGTGVYKISLRTQDKAGHWSGVVSDYLVVYDASSGVRFRGARTIDLTDVSNHQLPWLDLPTLRDVKFAFSVRYGSDGMVTKQSDFQFRYRTGEYCANPKKARDCHDFELNASAIQWLTTSGENQSVGTFKGTGTMRVDGVDSPITFIVTARDGERVDENTYDMVSMMIYPNVVYPYTQPLYVLSSTSIERGNIKIRF